MLEAGDSRAADTCSKIRPDESQGNIMQRDFPLTPSPKSLVMTGSRQGRVADAVVSSVALILSSPLFVIVAIGIWLSSPGPIMHAAKRVGLGGRIFNMYKFRTMHIDQGALSKPITAKDDSRVFSLGAWLRRLKIDELPQLLNILKGEMSIVGPRPEDPKIVNKYYGSTDFETLSILPGLASPGSIYNYTHGEDILDGNDVEESYAARVLPVKLGLDIVYVREASPVYYLRIVVRAIWVILLVALGRHHFPDPPEMRKAVQLGLIPKSL